MNGIAIPAESLSKAASQGKNLIDDEPNWQFSTGFPDSKSIMRIWVGHDGLITKVRLVAGWREKLGDADLASQFLSCFALINNYFALAEFKIGQQLAEQNTEQGNLLEQAEQSDSAELAVIGWPLSTPLPGGVNSIERASVALSNETEASFSQNLTKLAQLTEQITAQQMDEPLADEDAGGAVGFGHGGRVWLTIDSDKNLSGIGFDYYWLARATSRQISQGVVDAHLDAAAKFRQGSYSKENAETYRQIASLKMAIWQQLCHLSPG